MSTDELHVIQAKPIFRNKRKYFDYVGISSIASALSALVSRCKGKNVMNSINFEIWLCWWNSKKEFPKIHISKKQFLFVYIWKEEANKINASTFINTLKHSSNNLINLLVVLSWYFFANVSQACHISLSALTSKFRSKQIKQILTLI